MTKGAATALLTCLILLPLLLVGVGVVGKADAFLWVVLGILALIAAGGLLAALHLGKGLRQREERLQRQEAELTQSRKIQEEQGQALRLYARVAKSAKIGYFAWDLIEDRCISCSEEYAALHGVSAEQYFERAVDLRSDATFVHPDDRAFYLKVCAETLDSQQPLDIQYRIVTADGHVRYVREQEHSFTVRNGVATRSEGMIQDITDLRRSETLLLAAMNAGAAVYAIFDPDDHLILANPAYVSLFGERSVEVQIGMHFETIIRGTAAAGVIQGGDAEVEAWVQARLARRERPARGMKFQSEKGRWFEVDDIILDDGHVFTIGADITDRAAMEARLQQAQRMEAVGQLAAGMAHDFNNLLEVIHGNAELLADRAGEEAPMLEAIRQAAHRAGGMTQSLLAFSSRQRLRPQSLDLGALIEEWITQFVRSQDGKIKVRTKIAPNLPPVKADPQQLKNAIDNLLMNAAHAMPDGGLLTVRCAPFDPGSTKGTNLLEGKQYLSVVVSDNGKGMEPEVLAQAFEPFFTTDQGQNRSGLGLSMVYGFAEQSGGRIHLVSQQGQGTEAHLVLPAAERLDIRPAPAKNQAAAEPAPGRGERILLLDDNDAVRAVLRTHLKRLGYRIAEAADAERAAAILRSEEIDLALVDIMLSDDCSGPQFVTQARRSRPELPVIYISGYSAERALLDPGTPLLTKPFTRHDMAQAIRDQLEQAPLREPAP